MNDRPLSARTRAEMAAGAKQVAAATAWGTADRCEQDFRSRFKGKGHVQILASYNEGAEVWELETKVWPDKDDTGCCVTLPPEPYGVFPSETLTTQIMLVMG